MNKDELSKNEKMRIFLHSIYVPKGRAESWGDLIARIECIYNLRSVNKNDAGKSHYNALIIETKGDGKRETYQGWSVKYIDFNHVGDKYAEAYIYDADGNGYPTRIYNDSPKIAILF